MRRNEVGATFPSVELIRVTRKLSKDVDRLAFAEPVTHVYNPLRYARAAHETYLERFGGLRGRVVLLGMNPGPWGMAQTGVPFGEVAHVRDWMGIEAKVRKPRDEHPKRPVDGFECRRSEVSGSRLWGWAASRFVTAEAFFARFFVINYCPLVFLEDTGRNRTPDKLPASERRDLFAVCDKALLEQMKALEPQLVVGVGTFARTCARRVLTDQDVRVGSMLHPSPASPKANRGWAPQAEQDLAALGVRL